MADNVSMSDSSKEEKQLGTKLFPPSRNRGKLEVFNIVSTHTHHCPHLLPSKVSCSLPKLPVFLITS